MLPANHRLRDAGQYRAVLRERRAGRAGGTFLVVHCVDTDAIGPTSPRGGPRVGFVVSKAIGNAVVRARTKRVLRHLMADRLAALPAGLDVVIRANPAIAGQPSATVATELDAMLAKALRRHRRNLDASGSRRANGSLGDSRVPYRSSTSGRVTEARVTQDSAARNRARTRHNATSVRANGEGANG